MPTHGVTLARLLLALDRTVATLVTHSSGLDATIGTLAMVDADDLRFGLSRDAGRAQLFLFVGVPDDAIRSWLAGLGTRRPIAIMCKAPSEDLGTRAEDAGIAVISVDPHARWERIYNLVSRVLDVGRADDAAMGRSLRTGPGGDLFDLAAEVARRTHGLVSIEDERSHVLAYSSAGDEADELRRLSILGREGPPEMLAWLRQWGVMDALRTSDGVVEVDERADLGLRPRRAVAIRVPTTGRVTGPAMGEFLGVVWLQEGRAPLSEDADDVLIGAAAVAARMISRRRAIGTEHDEVVRRLIGGRGDRIDADHLGDQLSIAVDAPILVVGFAARPAAAGDPASRRLGDGGEVSALTLHASAFSPLSVTTTIGQRAYVVVPQQDLDATVRWARVAVEATAHQFSLPVQAVVAGPGDGLAAAPALRTQVDRVLDAAQSQSDLVHDDVTTVAASQTGVLLGEILGHLAAHPELVDPRVVELARYDARTGGELTLSLRAYLDAFGDVRAAAETLHVHPNTLRYRVRRAQELTGMDLTEPATRLVVALSLRAPARPPEN